MFWLKHYVNNIKDSKKWFNCSISGILMTLFKVIDNRNFGCVLDNWAILNLAVPSFLIGNFYVIWTYAKWWLFIIQWITVVSTHEFFSFSQVDSTIVYLYFCLRTTMISSHVTFVQLRVWVYKWLAADSNKLAQFSDSSYCEEWIKKEKIYGSSKQKLFVTNWI